MAFKAGQFASDDYFKGQQIDVMKSRYGGGGGSQVTAEDIVTGLNAGDGITPDVTEDEIVDPDVAASMSAGAKGLPIRQSIMARQQRMQQPTLVPLQGTPAQRPRLAYGCASHPAGEGAVPSSCAERCLKTVRSI